MKISALFKKKTVLSFEVFPPKRAASPDTLYGTLEELRCLSPDFISVTFGAGGSENSASTIAVASAVKNVCEVDGVAHLTCINQTREEVRSALERLREHRIENILALRGDIRPDIPPKGDFRHACDLISFIKETGDFNIIAACYPEGHPEASGICRDIQNLKIKTDAGADHLISQLFFDNGCFYSFLERAKRAGIRVPVEAGIMPVVNGKQIERMVSLCGVRLPKKFTAMMRRYEDRPEAMRDAGIAYAVDQIVDLVSQGVDGIHLYTMNNAYIAQRISASVKSLFAPSA